MVYVSDDSKVDNKSFTISSSSKVGATIADDIKNSSYWSGFLALFAIFIYILIRFRKWQFSIGAVVALLHDSLFVISAFSIANLMGISYEIDQVFIAAILTIIGYSINDTVVVFDRISLEHIYTFSTGLSSPEGLLMQGGKLLVVSRDSNSISNNI